jgi:hypothetical protein
MIPRATSISSSRNRTSSSGSRSRPFTARKRAARSCHGGVPPPLHQPGPTPVPRRVDHVLQIQQDQLPAEAIGHQTAGEPAEPLGERETGPDQHGQRLVRPGTGRLGHGAHQVRLAGEIGVDRALGQAEPGRHRVERRGLDPLLKKERRWRWPEWPPGWPAAAPPWSACAVP